VTTPVPPQQTCVPMNYVMGANNQAVMFVPANTVIATPGLTVWPSGVVPQLPVMPVTHVADTREISEQDFHREVGKKL